MVVLLGSSSTVGGGTRTGVHVCTGSVVAARGRQGTHEVIFALIQAETSLKNGWIS